ncbi:hypothetical protein NKI15_19860 [Mesorhizobium sp. M0862]|uniref:hypothetical protein n=1 Tax=Mesorhizobium sp. M0862 TaxID=2957015 RepID=UPI00333BBF5C
MPVRYYSKEKRRNLRALQIFSILSAAAHRRETLTYAGLAELLGYAGAGVFAQTLDLILKWCAVNELPPILLISNGRAPLDAERDMIVPERVKYQMATV